jgi:hypothetical protein
MKITFFTSNFLKIFFTIRWSPNYVPPKGKKNHFFLCENCHAIDVIISSTNDVHCNDCHSKSKVLKSDFLCGSIVTNDGLI